MSRPAEQPVSGRGGAPLPAGVPAKPRWLHKFARAEWDRLVRILGPLGRLTEADGAPLAALCEAAAEMRLAAGILKEEGRFFKTATGYLAPHPAVAQQRSAWAAVERFSELFGLDPASRAKMGASAGPAREGVAARKRG